KVVGGKNTAYPAGAKVIDAAGKFIVPGLIDMHVHYRPWLGELFLNYGVTSIAVPGNPAYEPAEREPSYRPEARSPRIFSTSCRPGRRRASVGIRGSADDRSGARGLPQGQVPPLGAVPERSGANRSVDQGRGCEGCLFESDARIRARIADRPGSRSRGRGP